MMFGLKRTSIWGDDKPCDSALRDETNDLWQIDINTIDELLEFAKEQGGNLIINVKGKSPHIEIYDDYRE